MKIWVTRYVPTRGLLCYMDAEQITLTSVRIAPGQCLHKGEWHTCRDEAVAEAEAIRTKHLVSLRKSLHRLENMDFKTEVVFRTPQSRR